MRYASVDRVVEHVAGLKEKYGLSVLTIYDDQILMNKARAKELFSKLAPLKIRVEMPNGVTLSYIDEELAGLMKAAGVDTIFLGDRARFQESPQGHHPQTDRLQSNFKPTIQLLQNAGIFTCAFS